MKHRRRIAWLIPVVLLAAIGTSIQIDSPPVSKKDSVSDSVSGNSSSYAVNSSGQTYGSASNASSSNDRPELIAAIGKHGISGYIYSSDLMDGAPSTPAEAIAQQESYQKLAANWDGKTPIIVRTIPLYDVEGKTVLDEYDISFTPNH